MTRRKDPRTTRLPVTAGELPAFTPVPRRCERHDGWTPERQRGFIEALADTGSVGAAARAVDMAERGAYALRREAGAEGFRAASEAALALGIQCIEDVAMDRALNGTEEPVYSYGKLIGTRIKHNDRLLMFMLRNRAPERFAAGGAPRGLNAVSRQRLARLHKEWEADYLARQRNVPIAEVRASIDRKIEEVQRRADRVVSLKWSLLAEEARAAWARFVTLRTRDLAGMEADPATRKAIEVAWNTRADHFDPPERLALPAPKER